MLDLNTGETIVDLTCGNWQDHLSHAGSYYPEPATRTDEKQEHLACVPLFVQETIIGTLCVSHTGALTPDSLRVLEAMGNIAANAVFDQQRVRRERQQTYDSTLEGWVYALELRDNETKDHTRRVTAMTVELARACGMRGDDLVQVWRGALLHDIGKIAIPDSILLKPGKLTEEEWQIMREHPRYAYDMLISIPFLQAALDIPYYHHEKWDGTGYPYGLQGEDIPLAARIFAVVDVWDALRFDRPYRKAWSEQRVIEHLIALAGTHFDPHIVDIFLDLLQTRPHIFSQNHQTMPYCSLNHQPAYQLVTA
jgi:HD-GYP domain-containing protein (c-di-GMP phosphodiesterase class II)